MAEAPELLQRLHGVALRAASRKAGKTFEGCSVASRWLKSQGCVDKKILKGLFSLDVTTAWNRHASEPKCKEFEARLFAALSAIPAGSGVDSRSKVAFFDTSAVQPVACEEFTGSCSGFECSDDSPGLATLVQRVLGVEQRLLLLEQYQLQQSWRGSGHGAVEAYPERLFKDDVSSYEEEGTESDNSVVPAISLAELGPRHKKHVYEVLAKKKFHAQRLRKHKRLAKAKCAVLHALSSADSDSESGFAPKADEEVHVADVAAGVGLLAAPSKLVDIEASLVSAVPAVAKAALSDGLSMPLAGCGRAVAGLARPTDYNANPVLMGELLVGLPQVVGVSLVASQQAVVKDFYSVAQIESFNMSATQRLAVLVAMDAVAAAARRLPMIKVKFKALMSLAAGACIKVAVQVGFSSTLLASVDDVGVLDLVMDWCKAVEAFLAFKLNCHLCNGVDEYAVLMGCFRSVLCEARR